MVALTYSSELKIELFTRGYDILELYILNRDFQAIHLLDTFESLLWTERYYECGDFEITSPASVQLLRTFEKENYLWSKDSNMVMIIEDIEISSDTEEGTLFMVKGRSLESILDRRIIWNKTTLTGNLQNAIHKILNENVISPSDSERRISNFIFEASDDPLVTEKTVELECDGETIYEVIQTLCQTNELGFRVLLNNDNQFVFQLYAGADRSYDQDTNPYVLFSPKFENIINSNYLESNKTLKTVALVVDDSGDIRTELIVECDTGAGRELDRREIQVAVSISSEEGNVTAKMEEAGREELKENKATKTFEGEVESTQLFVYGEDFFMGDIVQIVNEYEVEAKTRVVEIVRSQTLEGMTIYPTFETVE